MDSSLDRTQTTEVDNPFSDLLQLQLTRYQLLKWVEYAAALFGCMSFVLITIIANSPLILALVPSLLLDGWIIAESAFLLPKQEQYGLLRLALKRVYLLDLVESTGSALFKALTILAWLTEGVPFTLAALPFATTTVVRLCLRTNLLHECYSFSSMVRLTQIMTVTRWIRLLTVICVALKLDEQVAWSWSEAVWPLWVSACFVTLIDIGVFVLTVSAILSFLTGETNDDEVFATLWLFYSVTGSLAVFGSLCVQAFHYEAKPLLPVIFSLVFLAGFLVFTFYGYERLTRWWTAFFIMEVEEDDEQAPQIQPQPRASLPSQIRAAIKAPPRMLMRLSSSYFQPAQVVPPLQLPQKRRTMSDKDQKTIMEEEEPSATTTHRRYQSSALQPVSSPRVQLVRRPSNYAYSGESDSGKVCDMCCENVSNAVVMECGHGGICYECSLVLWKATGACHMCRTPISQVLQIANDPGNIVKVISTTRAVYKTEE